MKVVASYSRNISFKYQSWSFNASLSEEDEGESFAGSYEALFDLCKNQVHSQILKCAETDEELERAISAVASSLNKE